MITGNAFHDVTDADLSAGARLNMRLTIKGDGGGTEVTVDFWAADRETRDAILRKMRDQIDAALGETP